MDYQSIDSSVDPSACVYLGARLKHSTLAPHVVVGNYSRVDFSHLEHRVRIDRGNHLYHVLLGKHSYTGINTVLMHVNIGSFCSISWNVSIGGPNHDFRRVSQHSFLYNDHDNLRPASTAIPYDRFSESLTIGNDVWVAAGAVVTRGVKIGDGAVIGANAVVTNDVPPYAIVAGSPAKVLRFRFGTEIIDLLLRLKWWNWDEAKIKENFDMLSVQPDADRLRLLITSEFD